MENTKTITTNKKAFHEYFVLESLECGIELSGTEIKSIRQGGANLKDAWCSVDGGEMIIKQLHISPYEHGQTSLIKTLQETGACCFTSAK